MIFYESHHGDMRITRTEGNKHNRLQCAAHLHYQIELVLVLNGHPTAFVDTDSYRLDPGDVFIAFPNQIHRYESEATEEYFLFIVSPDLMPELSSTFLSATPRCPRLAGMANDPDIRYLAERLHQNRYSEASYELLIRRGYLQVLFSKLLSKLELVAADRKDFHALESIISYCTQHYRDDLTLATLSEALHINKYYISHLFSDRLHIGFNSYINSLRISYACHYLKHSDMSVTEIAEEVGFGTSRTFNRAFLKQNGCTPSAYRTGAPGVIFRKNPKEKKK